MPPEPAEDHTRRRFLALLGGAATLAVAACEPVGDAASAPTSGTTAPTTSRGAAAAAPPRTSAAATTTVPPVVATAAPPPPGIPSVTTTTVPPSTTRAPGTAPVRVVSFGPNGTHWPQDSPWLHATDTPHVVEVDCTWSAIATALAAITPEQAAQGAHVRVRPGSLDGNGASQGSKPVLDDLGDTGWQRRVLVSPRDGWGTVTIASSARLNRVRRVNFAGLDGAVLQFTGCSGSALSWSTPAGTRMNGLAGQQTSGFDFHEVVVRTAVVGNSDPTNWGGGTRDGVLFDCGQHGCYTAPQYRPTGGDGHNDSHQLQTGGADYWGFEMVDCALFGSTNSASQIGGWRKGSDQRVAAVTGRPTTDPVEFFVRYEHTMLLSAAVGRARYPLPAQAQALAANAAVNGEGRPGSLVAVDCLFAGSLYKSKKTLWGSVTGTLSTDDRPPVRDGSWTVDPSLADLTAAQLESLSPLPTDDYLRMIWG